MPILKFLIHCALHPFLISKFLIDFVKYKKLTNLETVRFRDIMPFLYEKNPLSQSAQSAYFFQDVWALQKISRNSSNLHEHIDVGSRIDGFVGQLSAFRPVTFIDIRSITDNLLGIKYKKGSITDLPYRNSEIYSLSSLCVIEHIGLGRYGDHIDPNGSLRAIKEIQRVLKIGGDLYVSVPVGKERVAFNAHRIFSPYKFVSYFTDCDLLEYSLVQEQKIIFDIDLNYKIDSADYAMGLFHFRKK
jgi:SAM-dependent methyltransferase